MKWRSIGGLGVLGVGLLACALPPPSTVGTDSEGTVEHSSYPVADATDAARANPEEETEVATSLDPRVTHPTPAAGPDAQPRPVVPLGADAVARLDRIDARIDADAPKADEVDVRTRAHAYAMLSQVKQERAAIDQSCAAPGKSAEEQAKLMDALTKLERDLDELERVVSP